MVVLGLVTVVLGAIALEGFAATSATSYDPVRVPSPDPQPSSRWGDRLRDAGDLNGDGVNDLWLAQYSFDFGGLQNVGRVYAVSGKDRSLLYTINPPEPQNLPSGRGGFGWSISNVGDVDGDGTNDVLVGSPRHNVNPGSGASCEPDGAGGTCNENQGRAWVFSGATEKPKTPLLQLDNPRPQGTPTNFANFGYRLGRAGDLNGDGRSELLVGAPNNDWPTAGCANSASPPPGCRRDQGQAFIFDGATGDLLPEPRGVLNVPEEDRYLEESGVCTRATTAGGPRSSLCGEFGVAAQGPGDATGDGVPDQLVSAWTYSPGCGAGDPSPCMEAVGRIYLFSGATGQVVHKLDNPEPQQGARFGLQEVAAESPGDVNGDGGADLYGNGFAQDTPQTAGPAEGKAWVFSGKTGAVLYSLSDPTPESGGQFGYSLVRTDYNKDGAPDLYVGSSPHHEPGTDQLGGTYIFNGPNGSVLKILDLPPSDVQRGTPENLGPQLGRAVAAPGDLNGDGEPDYAAGAPTTDVGSNQDQGRLYIFLSNIPQPPLPPPGGPSPPPAADTCATEGAPGYLWPAKMRVRRAEVDRDDRVLDVYAPITSRAQGDVDVTYQGARRTTTFDAKITEGAGELDRIRFRKKITRAQARLGQGIVTLNYKGDANTRAEEVRLRAATRRAQLDVDRISLVNGRLSARGSVTRRANGVVRLRYSYIDAAGNPQIWPARATIHDDGDWELKNKAVPPQLAKCGGYLSILFTGFFERRIRGEMLAYQLNPGQTRTPTTKEK